MTIKMQRDGKFADVHPQEVENMSCYGWTIVEEKKPVPVARSVDETQEMVVPKHFLADFVDDRALPALKSIGVLSVEDFLAADEGMLERLPYVTKRTIAKIKAL